MGSEKLQRGLQHGHCDFMVGIGLFMDKSTLRVGFEESLIFDGFDKAAEHDLRCALVERTPSQKELAGWNH